MGDSFTTAVPLSRMISRTSGKRLKVLVTGAAGNIGSYFATHSSDRYDLRLMVHDKDDTGPIKDAGELLVADITDPDQVKKACSGMDVVVHLAADPSPEAQWDTILPVNIDGTYNVFTAAKGAGVKRVIYASSIHAVSGYPADVQVGPDFPVNPGDLYGVSKCFGEALGRYMAEQQGLSCIAIRIGAFQPKEAAEGEGGIGMMDAWVSQRDLTQLMQKCIEADHIRWAVVHGLSDNRFKRMDITSARELFGYEPQDDLTEVNETLKALNLDETVESHSDADS